MRDATAVDAGRCAEATFPRDVALAFFAWPGATCACVAAYVTRASRQARSSSSIVSSILSSSTSASSGVVVGIEEDERGGGVGTSGGASTAGGAPTPALAVLDPKSSACRRARMLAGVGVFLTGATALTQWRAGRAFAGIPNPERVEVGFVIGLFSDALAAAACAAAALLGRGGILGPTKMQLLRQRLDEEQFRQLVSLRDDEEMGNVSDSGGSPDVSVARGPHFLSNQGMYEIAPSIFKRELEGAASSNAVSGPTSRAGGGERGTASRRATRPPNDDEVGASRATREQEYKSRREDILQRLHAANRLS